ncbi:MAG: penicillin-binding protein 2, partial [Gammaproteobacteria bacterium]|nr:penicillin-binding protein 2 [Gammaproteobacteria bacterium]
MAVFFIAAIILAARAVNLQVLDNEFLRSQGQVRHLRVETVPAHRGMITARHGEPLAVSTPVDSVWVEPKKMIGRQGAIAELAELLEMNARELTDALEARATREFFYVKRHMSPEDARLVMLADIPGVHLQREYRRYYPAGEVAAHVVGFTNIDDAGQEGLELSFDDWLKGRSGAKRVLKDRLGRTVEDVESIHSPRPGQKLTTSLDLRIQYLAYRELKSAVKEHGAKSGSIVVVDVETGEILAMA